VDSLTAKTVVVVPTVSIPQGLAAMVAYVPTNSDKQQLASAMAASADLVRTGELTRAVRASSTSVGPVEEGDWLGLADGELQSVHDDELTALTQLLDHLIAEDSELVTIITGLGARPAITAAIEDWLVAHHPAVATEFLKGDQPLYPYLISVE
jgi:dihydroxyacetone kinase-like predicted kinase